jgi:hypothetical protein
MAILGILIATGGMYFSLTDRASSDKSPAEEESPTDASSPKFAIPRSVVYQAAIFVGLAILGLAHASHTEPLPRSVLADGMRGTVFYLGACLALVGAVGVVFSSNPRAVVLSAAILGIGGATVLGVSGNAIVGGLLLAGAALCGWWLHKNPQSKSTAKHPQQGEQPIDDTDIEQALSGNSQPTPEPLLTSVAVVLFCWILGSTLQSAVEEGTGSKAAMSGSSRALPRPAFEGSARHAIDGSGKTDKSASISEKSSRDDTLFWCAAGLLAATIGLGYSRTEGADSRPLSPQQVP